MNGFYCPISFDQMSSGSAADLRDVWAADMWEQKDLMYRLWLWEKHKLSGQQQRCSREEAEDSDGGFVLTLPGSALHCCLIEENHTVWICCSAKTKFLSLCSQQDRRPEKRADCLFPHPKVLTEELEPANEWKSNTSLVVCSFHEPAWCIKRMSSAFTKSYESWKGRTESFQHFKQKRLNCRRQTAAAQR